MDGLGVRSACMLAPSAFLASAAAWLPLQDAILAGSVQSIEDHTVTEAKSIWMARANTTIPTETTKHVQKAWDTPITPAIVNRLLHNDSNTLTYMARLRAAAAPYSGDWLHAPGVGLRLSDEAIRVAVSYRLGCATCQPHSCVCSAIVDKTGLHGLFCMKSASRHILNKTILLGER